MRPTRELTLAELADLERADANFKTRAQLLLEQYERDSTFTLPALERWWLSIGDHAPRLRAADARADAAKEEARDLYAADRKAEEVDQLTMGRLLATNLQQAARLAASPLVEAARQARVEGKLTPAGTKEILKAVAQALSVAIRRTVVDAGISTLISRGCELLLRAESTDTLVAELDLVAAALARGVATRVPRLQGLAFVEEPTVEELATAIAVTGKRALAVATGDDQAVDMSDHDPMPRPVAVGQLTYYRKRHTDFLRRYPHAPPAPPEYYLRYGDKYAHRFAEELKPRLGTEGRAWVDRTLVLLQESIEGQRSYDPIAFDHLERQPDQLRALAFAAHAKSYIHAGLHRVPVAEYPMILLTPEPGDLLSKEAILQAIETVREVVPQKLEDWSHSR